MAWTTDLADRSSPALATVIERVLNDPDRSDDATLAMVREAMEQGLIEDMVRGGELAETDRDAVSQELEDLARELGEDIPAVHLLRYRAASTLSALIRELLARWEDPERPPTLAHVREAIDTGLLAELVGEGVIDPDQDDTVMRQLDDLIQTHGEHALAEELVKGEDDTL